ncbi:hypothetical protein H4R18_003651 [Coemansia javaensis]|uniref:DNA damage-binding protein 1 n=1 Tax=Coemansia javaensis TaxID=2761396 RepID=A0A9W8LHC4_9FUNG|nr:hypothetical protein H4R18_003651 [Coemansia javaensis]
MQYQYVVSAHKASSVTCSVSGAFTAAGRADVVVARGARVAVQTLSGGRLRRVGEWTANGRIAALQLVHPADRATALVVAVSDRFQFAVLAWDAEARAVATESTGALAEPTGRAAADRVLLAGDARLVVVGAYQGIVHLLPLHGARDDAWRALLRRTHGGGGGGDDDSADGGAQWPYSAHGRVAGGLALPAHLVRGGGRGKGAAHVAGSGAVHRAVAQHIRELRALDDANGQRQVQAYRAGERLGGLCARELWASPALDAGAARLVALPGGRLLVVGAESLAVLDGARVVRSLAKRAAAVGACEWLDAARAERLLLADEDGVLSLVVLRWAGAALADLLLERLGDAPVATALAHLGDGHVFVGSHCGDQALVRLHTEPIALPPPPGDEPADAGPLAWPLGEPPADAAADAADAAGATMVERLESFPSLAPLVDLCAGPGGVVACAGLRTEPGLRVVRNGVGIARAGCVDLPGVVGLWSLTTAAGRVLVAAALVGRTVLLGWDDSDSDNDDDSDVAVEPLRLPGWRLDEQTLAAGLARGGRHAVQVTPRAAVLLDAESWAVRCVWTPESAGLARISAACVAGDQIALAADGDTVVYLERRGDALAQAAARRMPAAVACIDVHAWDEAAGAAAHVAVGLWAGGDVRLLALPDLAPVLSLRQQPKQQGAADQAGADLGGADHRHHHADAPPRSVLMQTLGGARYVVVGSGDGRLHQFRLAAGGDAAVCEHKCVALGSGPLALVPLGGSGGGVFAAGAHSAVLSADDGGRVTCAAVDVRGVQRAAAVRARALPGGLCLAVGDRLWLGSADAVQRLHVRTRALPRWAAPHRVAHSAGAGLLGLATIHALDAAGRQPLAAAASDARAWERLALMGAGTQQLPPPPPVAVAPPVEAGRFSVLDAADLRLRASVLLRPFETPECLCAATLAPSDGATPALEDAFVLGTSIVLPGEDDARRGRIIVACWDRARQRLRIVASLVVMGAVYALAPFRGMLLAAVANRLLLVTWQPRRARAAADAPPPPPPPPPAEPRAVGPDAVVVDEDPACELAVACSQQTQIMALALAVTADGDHVAVGDLLMSVSLFRYERDGEGAHRLVPVARDYAGLWTTALAAVPPPLARNAARLEPPPVPDETGFLARQPDGGGGAVFARAFRGPECARLLAADSHGNLVRLAHAGAPPAGDAADPERLYVEARWRLGDMVNVIRPGSLVMDVPDPEFPDVVRPLLVFGTVLGALGVVASVEDGRVGRILDRLQTNMAALLPTPGLWDYAEHRAFSADHREVRAFGFLDGDLIERFLDLPRDTQLLVFSGGGALVDRDLLDAAEHRCKSDYWASYSRVEAEGDAAVFAQMAVSDIGRREGVDLDYVVRLVECLTRIH